MFSHSYVFISHMNSCSWTSDHCENVQLSDLSVIYFVIFYAVKEGRYVTKGP